MQSTQPMATCAGSSHWTTGSATGELRHWGLIDLLLPSHFIPWCLRSFLNSLLHCTPFLLKTPAAATAAVPSLLLLLPGCRRVKDIDLDRSASFGTSAEVRCI